MKKEEAKKNEKPVALKKINQVKKVEVHENKPGNSQTMQTRGIDNLDAGSVMDSTISSTKQDLITAVE